MDMEILMKLFMTNFIAGTLCFFAVKLFDAEDGISKTQKVFMVATGISFSIGVSLVIALIWTS